MSTHDDFGAVIHLDLRVGAAELDTPAALRARVARQLGRAGLPEPDDPLFLVVDTPAGLTDHQRQYELLTAYRAVGEVRLLVLLVGSAPGSYAGEDEAFQPDRRLVRPSVLRASGAALLWAGDLRSARTALEQPTPDDPDALAVLVDVLSVPDVYLRVLQDLGSLPDAVGAPGVRLLEQDLPPEVRDRAWRDALTRFAGEDTELAPTVNVSSGADLPEPLRGLVAGRGGGRDRRHREPGGVADDTYLACAEALGHAEDALTGLRALPGLLRPSRREAFEADLDQARQALDDYRDLVGTALRSGGGSSTPPSTAEAAAHLTALGLRVPSADGVGERIGDGLREFAGKLLGQGLALRSVAQRFTGLAGRVEPVPGSALLPRLEGYSAEAVAWRAGVGGGAGGRAGGRAGLGAGIDTGDHAGLGTGSDAGLGTDFGAGSRAGFGAGNPAGFGAGIGTESGVETGAGINTGNRPGFGAGGRAVHGSRAADSAAGSVAGQRLGSATAGSAAASAAGSVAGALAGSAAGPVAGAAPAAVAGPVAAALAGLFGALWQGPFLVLAVAVPLVFFGMARLGASRLRGAGRPGRWAVAPQVAAWGGALAGAVVAYATEPPLWLSATGLLLGLGVAAETARRLWRAAADSWAPGHATAALRRALDGLDALLAEAVREHWAVEERLYCADAARSVAGVLRATAAAAEAEAAPEPKRPTANGTYGVHGAEATAADDWLSSTSALETDAFAVSGGSYEGYDGYDGDSEDDNDWASAYAWQDGPSWDEPAEPTGPVTSPEKNNPAGAPRWLDRETGEGGPELVATLAGDLTDAALVAMAPYWGAVERGQAGTLAVRRTEERVRELLSTARRHLQHNGVLAPPPFASDRRTRAISANLLGTDSRRLAELVGTEADQQAVVQLSSPEQSALLDRNPAAAVWIRFAPGAVRDEVEKAWRTTGSVQPEEALWTSSGRYAGLLRLTPLRMGVVDTVRPRQNADPDHRTDAYDQTDTYERGDGDRW
ncbi:hypothetical protein [Streptomyces sp. NPDC002845]